MSSDHSKIFYVTGVSGSGKTTIGKLLAEKLELPFFDADDFHPESNIAKMSKGIPLEDIDRWPWLKNLNELAQSHPDGAVITCSALKESYRKVLKEGLLDRVHWVHLHGSIELISSRMQQRKEHFMPTALLQSQFDILELPKQKWLVDINQSTTQMIDQILKKLKMQKSEFGIIGLGVMGRNLARNLGRNQTKLSLYNRYVPHSEEQVAGRTIEEYSELDGALGFEDLKGFVDSLERPRKMLLMINATVVDPVLDQLVPLLNVGDMIIDGGNSHYALTNTRKERLAEKGIDFLGMGISGGEEGALNGPALMPGGKQKSYKSLEPFLQKISAKNKNGDYCVDWIGKGGSGHFVKMIHNGIEYAEMQLLAECYDLLHHSMGKSYDEIASIFSSWNEGKLNSYLLEITADIFTKKEEGEYILNKILDQASNKGTGAWASIAGIELGVPFNIIASALYARYSSSQKAGREKVAEALRSTDSNETVNFSLTELEEAYGLARLLNHLQGFEYMLAASKKFDWNLTPSSIAKIWTGGCIIRSELMFEFVSHFQNTQELLSSKNWVAQINDQFSSLKKVSAQAMMAEIPVPSFTACLNYLNGMKQARSSANLIQAQRDYFGAHGYKKVGDKSQTLYHTNWMEI